MKNQTKQGKSVIASETIAKRDTSPQLRSSDSVRKREWAQLRKQNPHATTCHSEGAKATEESQKLNRDISAFSKPQYDKNIDCHEFAIAESRNDDMATEYRNDDNTPPQTPPARGGAYIYSLSHTNGDSIDSPSLAEGARGWVNSNKAPKLAIVIPCYNEEAVIAHTYNALCKKLDSLIAKGAVAKDSFLCFVDDGSVDKTVKILLSLKNAKTACHTELSEVSKSNINTYHTEDEARSISNTTKQERYFANAQYDKNMDCHEPNGSRNDSTNSPSLAEGEQENGDSAMKEKQKANPHIMEGEFVESPHKLIKLTRNYGHQNALLAGLEFVKDKCDCVVSIDSDLQDDINAIDEMLFKFKNGADIVYGVRKARDNDTAFKKYTALSFYKFMQIMGVQILYNHADYRLLSARACGALLEFREVNLFLRGVVPLVGYKSAVVYYDRAARFAGESKYPLGKMLAFALNGITSFSIAPLRMMSVVGVILCALSVIYGAYAIFIKLFTDSTLEGWTSTILLVLFFGGMQFLGLGIMGEYIGKIYAEVKHRPRYIIESIL